MDVSGNSSRINSSNSQDRPGPWTISLSEKEAMAPRSDAELSAAEALVIFVYKLHTSPAPSVPPAAVLASISGGGRGRGDGSGGGGGAGISGVAEVGSPADTGRGLEAHATSASTM